MSRCRWGPAAAALMAIRSCTRARVHLVTMWWLALWGLGFGGRRVSGGQQHVLGVVMRGLLWAELREQARGRMRELPRGMLRGLRLVLLGMWLWLLRAAWLVALVLVAVAAGAAAVLAGAAVLARFQLLHTQRGLHCATRLCAVVPAAAPLSLLGRQWVCTWQLRRRAAPQHPAVPRGSASLRLCFIARTLGPKAKQRREGVNAIRRNQPKLPVRQHVRQQVALTG